MGNGSTYQPKGTGASAGAEIVLNSMGFALNSVNTVDYTVTLSVDPSKQYDVVCTYSEEYINNPSYGRLEKDKEGNTVCKPYLTEVKIEIVESGGGKITKRILLIDGKGGTGMKKRTCMILALLICVLVLLSGGCAIGDLTGKDTYKGKPLYQFDVENNTVEIDGVMYRAVWEIPDDTIHIREIIGFLWEKPNFEIEDGVVYTISLIGNYPDKEYLYARSYTFYEVGNRKRLYEMNLKKVE